MTDLDREISRIKNIMLIHEGKQDLLREYHRDQKFPNREFGKTYGDAFLDWIEDKGQYGELSASRTTFDDAVKSGLENATKWASKYYKVTENELYNDLLNNKYGFFTNHIEDKKGNIYVERAISIPYLNDWDVDYNYYNTLVQRYENNVGGCWSWKKGNAKAYCGSNKEDDSFILKGWIRTDDIDWIETDYINSSFCRMNNECEIRVKPNAKIELFEIETPLKIKKDKFGKELPYDKWSNYKLPLKKNILVTATYFGNKEEYNGNYAKIFDAQNQDVQKYVDRKGNIFTHDELKNKNQFFGDDYEFFDGFALIEDKDKGYNFINPNGQYLSNQWFDEAEDFQNGFAIIKIDGKGYNFINTNGQIISQVWFDKVKGFNEGFAAVYLNDKGWNAINKRGQLISKQWFDKIGYFYNGVAKITSKYGGENFINTNGQLMLKQWADYLSNFKNGFAKIQIKEKLNFIDYNGNILSENLWFDEVYDFYDGLAKVMLNGKYNCLNEEGKILSENLWFDEIGSFKNGLADVRIEKKYNYLKINGELLSKDMWFDYIGGFVGDLAQVKLNGKYNFLKKTGELLTNSIWFTTEGKLLELPEPYGKSFLEKRGDKVYIIQLDGTIKLLG